VGYPARFGSVTYTESDNIGLDIFEKLEDLRVLATVTNMGNKTMNILNDPRGTLSDFPTDTFKITDRNGVQPRFKGVKLKYIPVVSKAGDYRTIEPGDSVYVEHDRKQCVMHGRCYIILTARVRAQYLRRTTSQIYSLAPIILLEEKYFTPSTPIARQSHLLTQVLFLIVRNSCR
jgi:hypothetical protein